MRRSAFSLVLGILVLLLVALTGCGDGGSSSASTSTPASISVSPSSLSLTPGSVSSVSATVLDAKGNTAVNPPVLKYSSSNTAVANVSSTGAVCAGTWDANNIVCTAGAIGTANITVTSGSVTATVPVFSHARVDRVVVTPTAVDCKSQGQTVQFSAQVLSNGADITSTVGPISWASTAGSVATVDSNGLATAVKPGAGSVFASVSFVNSVPAAFTTCPVRSVDLKAQDATTNVSLAPSGTQQLLASAVDTAGTTISVQLTFVSSQPTVASVSGTGLVTALHPGTTTITATCSAATCNGGFAAANSNVVIAAVSGTSVNTVYATGTGTTSMVPIETDANTAGTAFTLPAQPNSLVINPLGTNAYLGSSGGLMKVLTSNNTVSNSSGIVGTVLADSPNDSNVIVTGTGGVVGLAVDSSKTDLLGISGATAAVFPPDSSKAFIAAGNTLWVYTPGSTNPKPLALPAALTSAGMLASGAFGYFGSVGNTVSVVASCNNALVDTQVTPGTPSLIAGLPNGSAVLAVDSPGIDVIAASTPLVDCPPLLTNVLTSHDFGQGTFTPRQLIVLPDSSKAYVTSNLPMLLVYDVAAGTTSTIPLAGGASAFTGGATLDSKTLYVGASDNRVHRIDVATGTDAQQISVSFTPDLVVVRPK